MVPPAIAQAGSTGRTVVVALGGNAILQPGQLGTFEGQLFKLHDLDLHVGRAVGLDELYVLALECREVGLRTPGEYALGDFVDRL
jgi:hypothetical protein